MEADPTPQRCDYAIAVIWGLQHHPHAIRSPMAQHTIFGSGLRHRFYKRPVRGSNNARQALRLKGGRRAHQRLNRSYVLRSGRSRTVHQTADPTDAKFVDLFD